MKIVKEFENTFGKAEVTYYEDVDEYMVTMRTSDGTFSEHEEYKYRSKAIEMFQFNCYWLDKHEKKVR